MATLQNKIQLITYADSLGNNLKDLQYVLDTYLREVVAGVHILPFYPSSADRGFAPLTHLEVDPKFGDWEDVREISKKYDLVVDLVVNHMSTDSRYFKDFLKKGDESVWKDLFLDVDELLKRHEELTDDALGETYRPRPSMPIQEFEFADGTKRRLWCTFTNSQVDLDLTHEKTRELMAEFILNLVKHNAKCIRLDAVGYTIKRPRTNSFLIPETFEMIHWIKDLVLPYHTDLLAEVHHDYRKQLQLARSKDIDWVYDFSLPLLTLHALHSGTSNNLKNWIQIRPKNQFTTLDTHDGIGVIDVEGLMTHEEVEHTIAHIHKNGGESAFRATGDGANNVDVYQVNTTYYSALGEQDDAYISARAIQFFLPGIPQVYYVGLLAGSNDIELLEQTDHGRDINRHYYSLEEIKRELDRDVVRRLFQLMKFRNTYPAFDGEFELVPSDIHELILKWEQGELYCVARIDLQKHTVSVEYVDEMEKVSKVRYF
jgi:sucrose phosphorylase